METSVVLPITGTMMDPSGSSLEADMLFERWNVRAGQTNPGMPMHVTLMSPFVDSRELDAMVLRRLEGALAPWDPFHCTLREVRTFDGEPVRAWLAPVPEETFIEMTRAIMDAFDLEPYGGIHPGIQPHVSVAKGSEREITLAIDRIEKDLPMSVLLDSFRLYALRKGAWEQIADRPLGI